jgi:hypothetical protein
MVTRSNKNATRHVTGGIFAITALLFLLAVASGCGGKSSGTPPPRFSIISPAQAAPAVVQQGGAFELAANITQPSPFTDTEGVHSFVYLSRAGVGGSSQTILVGSVNELTNRFAATVPPDTPTGLWDLKLISFSPGYKTAAFAANAVAVVQPFDGPFDFVVLTDYHVGDGTVGGMAGMPSEDLRAAVLNDIKTKSYEFALLTGDLNSSSYLYDVTFPQARDELKTLNTRPLFIVPGNHDGYIINVSGLFDGFVFWANTFGTNHYSFDAGNYHFTGFNSYEWDDDTRFGLSAQARGIIRQPQYDWIMADVASAKTRGKEPVLFAHHCPPDSWTAPTCTSGPDCNFVTSTAFHAAIRDAGVKWFICGHMHYNKLTVKDGVNYVYVSTAGGTTSGTLGWGYNIFHAATDGNLTWDHIEVVHKP